MNSSPIIKVFISMYKKYIKYLEDIQWTSNNIIDDILTIENKVI